MWGNFGADCTPKLSIRGCELFGVMCSSNLNEHPEYDTPAFQFRNEKKGDLFAKMAIHNIKRVKYCMSIRVCHGAEFWNSAKILEINRINHTQTVLLVKSVRFSFAPIIVTCEVGILNWFTVVLICWLLLPSLIYLKGRKMESSFLIPYNMFVK